MKLFTPIAIVLFLAIGGTAQENNVSAESLFYGLAQPIPKKLPLPNHPGKPAGRVSVAVTVDEKGKVTSADDADGPYPICKSVIDPEVLSLRNAAIEAAKKAVFTPATIENKPVAAKGRITYDFMSDRSGADSDSGTGSTGVQMRLDKLTKLEDSNAGVARVVNDDTSNKDGKGGSGNGGSSSRSSDRVPGGVLNGTAMSLDKPQYPAAARAVKAGGTVSVQVLIDINGFVHSAAAIAGHPLLRKSSEIAACSSRFLPTMLAGQPVKVSGVINYNFVP